MADMGFLPAGHQAARAGRRRRPADALLGHPGRRRGPAGPPLPDATRSPTRSTRRTATVTAMTHHVLHVDAERQARRVTRIAAREGRTIMFIGTKHARRPAGPPAARQGRTRGRAARRQVPAAAHPDPGAVPQRPGDRPGRHRRGGPRHPRRRPGHGASTWTRRPRRRTTCTGRPYRPGRRVRRRGHPGPAGAAPGRVPADGHRRHPARSRSRCAPATRRWPG